jgi:outer membrane immunogenic protein
MFRWGVLLAALMAAVPTAFAAAPKADFSGAYLGLQTSYGFGVQGDWCGGCSFIGPVSGAAGGEGGVVAGAVGGYDFSFGSFVAGVGLRASYADLAFDTLCGAAAQCRGALDWLGEAEVRAGFVIGDILVSGSAGLAVGDVEATAGGALTTSEIHDGHVFGLRGELTMSGGWRYGLEYRYTEMEGTNRLDTPTSAASDVAISWSAHTVGLTIVNEF